MRTTIVLVITLTFATPLHAQARSTRSRVGWTLAGIGIGFGAGVYVGFSKFDQATYAERKITTTAIGFAAAGGIVAFLLTRPKSTPSPRSTAALQGCRATVGRPQGLRDDAAVEFVTRTPAAADTWRQPFQLRRP